MTLWGIQSRILMMQDPHHLVRPAGLRVHAQECHNLPTEPLEVVVLFPQSISLQPEFQGHPQLNDPISLLLNNLVEVALLI